MDSLTAINERASIDLPDLGMDEFQIEVLKRLHLEFFFAHCRVLVTPHLAYTATGPTEPGEEDALKAILRERQERIEQMKRYLLYNLSLYSGLLEANSYSIALNNHLLISRFVHFKAHPGVYEVKLYTHSQEDLVAHYSDKIYLGRDFVSFDHLVRDHFGIAYIRDSLRQQVDKLKARIASRSSGDERAALESELIPEVEQSLGELSEQADALVARCPPRISAEGISREQLLDVNSRFRELKHTLSEAESTLREAEESLIRDSSDVARYVTKLRQDVTNDVDYIMVKVNGRISDAVNGIRI
jgi:hypothetical protein